MTKTEPGPPLWVAMEARRKALRIRWDALHHSQTRAKIKSGIMVRSDVTDDLDRDLRWVPGSADLAQREGIPPRPLEGSPDMTAEARLRRLQVVAKMNRASAMLADSPDDIPEHVLKDAERKSQEIIDGIRAGGVGPAGGPKDSTTGNPKGR